MKKIDSKIKQILEEPMKLDFIPQYKSNLKYIVQWAIEEMRNTVYGNEDAMDSLEEIIKKSNIF